MSFKGKYHVLKEAYLRRPIRNTTWLLTVIGSILLLCMFSDAKLNIFGFELPLVSITFLIMFAYDLWEEWRDKKSRVVRNTPETK